MDYIKKVEENFPEQIRTLQELISYHSTIGDPVMSGNGEVYPFGKGVQDAFAYTLKKGEDMGFDVKNVDNYGGHIDFGSGSPVVGIIGHLDVVPADDGWTFAPFAGEKDEEYIYGRGTTDDKGPVVSALYAMKALKDSGFQPAGTVRLILGLDEETNWKGMEYYLEHQAAPDYGFTPDGEFPALNGEKGILSFTLAGKLSRSIDTGLKLSKLSGGEALNMVAERARAVVNAKNREVYEEIKQKGALYREETGYSVTFRGVGSSLEILATGKAAHGATPQVGLNGISILMDFLSRLNFANDDINAFVDFYNRYIGFDVFGNKIGCTMEDERSGKLTFNVGKIAYTGEALEISVNVRYPVTKTPEQVYDAIQPILDANNMGIIKGSNEDPIYMDPDSPMIRTLMDVYKSNTGDTDSKPVVIGGGTYARAFENVVAFGALFPGDEDRMHQKDERVSIDRFMTMTKIYADALYRLAQENFHLEEDNG